MRLLFATTCVGITACQLNACAKATSDISADPFVDGPTRFLRAHELVHETKEENNIFPATLDANTSASNVNDGQEVVYKIKEERNIIAEAEAIASESSNIRVSLEQWLEKKHSTDNIFEILDLHNVLDKFFDHQKLKAWKLYVSKYKESNPSCDITLYDTLIYYFGPYGFNKIMENLSVDNKLKPTPTQQKWLDEVKTPEELFAESIVPKDKAIDDVLTDHSFIEWINYVKLFKKRNPSSHATIYDIVSARYKPKRQYRFITVAEGTPVTAPSVNFEQLLNWNIRPYDVFVWMKLDKYRLTNSGLLTSPIFDQWKNYLKLYNEKNPQSLSTVYQTLKEAYNDSMIKKFLRAAMKHWLRAYISPADVFKYLELDKIDPATISTLHMTEWYTYMTLFCNLGYTDLKDVLFHFKDIDVQLVDITYITTFNPYTINDRRKVLYGIMESWIDEDMSPTSRFIHLGLNTDEGNLFEKPCFDLWLRYVDLYNAKQKNSRKRKIDPDVFPATPEIDLNSFPATPEIDLNSFPAAHEIDLNSFPATPDVNSSPATPDINLSPATSDVNSSPATTPLSLLNSFGFGTVKLADLYRAANSEKKIVLTKTFKENFSRTLNNLDPERYESLIKDILPKSTIKTLRKRMKNKLDEAQTSSKKRKNAT